MRYALLLLSISAHAATLTISPPVIFSCSGTFGKATLAWKGAAGPVQLLVGPSRAVFTGFGATSGSAETGTWVGDGLEFRLVNQRGETEAQAVARVQCDAGELPGNGMLGTSYFPLEIGNQWIYREDSRLATGVYVTWTVTGLVTKGGKQYAEITATAGNRTATPLLLREDSEGTIWRYTITGLQASEVVYLKPSAGRRDAFQSPLGSYPDSVSYTEQATLVREERAFVRGVGLARMRSDLLTGSSGGFLSSMELVEFRLATGPHVTLPGSPRISLSAERETFNVTDRQLTNCIIPCYFAACGFGSPVDPPGTYKPCARTRIEAAAEGDFQVELALLDSNGVQHISLGPLDFSGEMVQHVQLPLFTAPNRPLAAGRYALTARMKRGQVVIGFATVLIEIQ